MRPGSNPTNMSKSNVLTHPVLSKTQTGKIVQANPRLDEKTRPGHEAVEIGEMSYFQADQSFVTYSCIYPQEITAVTFIYDARIKAQKRSYPSGPEVPPQTDFERS